MGVRGSCTMLVALGATDVRLGATGSTYGATYVFFAVKENGDGQFTFGCDRVRGPLSGSACMCPLGSVYLSGFPPAYAYRLNDCGASGLGTSVSALMNTPTCASYHRAL